MSEPVFFRGADIDLRKKKVHSPLYVVTHQKAGLTEISETPKNKFTCEIGPEVLEQG
jgi:hypothetical protein